MGAPIRHYDTLDSTNDEARLLAEAGKSGPLWVVADKQTGGRGRRGRAWVSEPGNLFASLLLRPDCPASELSGLVFAAALAVQNTVRNSLAGESKVRCKWPNDVLVDGAKVAGILLESSSSPSGMLDWVIVGIGINVENAPREDVLYSATSLAEKGSSESVEKVMSRLADRFAFWYNIWCENGTEEILSTWLDEAGGVGESVTVRFDDEELNGTFETITDDGTMILRLADGSARNIVAGDVFPVG